MLPVGRDPRSGERKGAMPTGGSERRFRRASCIRLLLVCGLVLPLSLGLARQPGAAAASATIATDALRLRTGPGTGYDVITLMYQGQSVTVLDGPQDGWYQVRSGSDTGWAFGDYLDLSGGGND